METLIKIRENVKKKQKESLELKSTMGKKITKGIQIQI